MDTQTGQTENTKEPEETETAETVLVETVSPPDRKRFFTKENASFFSSIGRQTPRKRKDAARMFEIVDKELLKTPEVSKAIPSQAKAAVNHYLVLRKLAQIAYRQNEKRKAVDVVCPDCKRHHRIFVQLPDVVMERNTITALGLIYDRLAPKLGSLHVDVKAESEISVATEVIAEVLLKYVPEEQRKECMQDIQMGLLRARNNTYGQIG